MLKRAHRFAAIFCLAATAPIMAGPQIITDRIEPSIDRTPAYINDTLRLSGVLGAAHGIRVVCNGPSDQFWRVYMQELLDLEAPERGTQLRSAMARAFNNSYSREARPGRSCDESTVQREASLAEQGRELAEKLASAHFPRVDRDAIE